jgi:hypothetical protein
MNSAKSIRVLGIAVVLYGVYNLLGIGNFKQFAVMLAGIPRLAVLVVYAFSIFYAVCCVYCGAKIMKGEDWARKMVLALTSVSVLLGFLLRGTVMANFREYVFSQSANVPPGMAGSVYNYTVILTVLATLFELAVIVVFTRRGVVEQFRGGEET